MEDLPVRAIVIGVSLFVTMAVLSAIILYFNSARTIADNVNERVDIAESFDNIMNKDNFEATLTGVEVRSLINKYAGVDDVQIDLILVDGADTNAYNNVNHAWLVQVNDNASIISEEKLNLIDAVWTCKVDKVETANKTTLKIRLNVKD